MRRLMLLRHAKTERDSPSGRDRDRRLDARGFDDAKLMRSWLAQQDHQPNLALVSTATRAQQTWEAIAPAFKSAKVEHDDALYAAEAGDILRIIHAAERRDPAQLIIVGHNPGLHELAFGLTGGGEQELRQALADNLPTCGLVVLDFKTDDWHDVSFRRGTLQAFMTPKLLKG